MAHLSRLPRATRVPRFTLGWQVARLLSEVAASGLTLTGGFASALEGIFASSSAVKQEAKDAVDTYTSQSDYFDVGPVTQPETGVTNA